jgi:hypothetical protein
MTDPTKWEKLRGQVPHTLLDSDPSGRYQSHQVSVWTDTMVERAAIWDTRDGRIAWVEDDVVAICWLPNGQQILAVRESYRPDPAARGPVIVTPVQSEFNYGIERRAWPSGEPLESGPVKLPMGWPVEVRCGPRGEVAGVAWRDQCESGIELFDLHGTGCQQRSDAGYFARSNRNSLMAFSPDCGFVVAAYGEELWWSDDPEQPSPGGRLKAGWVVVGDLARGGYREFDLIVSVPEGWCPDDPEDMLALEIPSTPKFADDGSFDVQLPQGCKHTINASGTVGAEPCLAPDG